MCMSQVSLICLFLLFSSCYVSVLANELDHKVRSICICQSKELNFDLSFLLQYEDGDDVVSWISRVGPLDNLQEIHSYFSLPFCKGSRITDPHQQTFNEILHGIKLESTGYEMKFKTDVSRTIYCMVELREDVVEAFTNAVKKNYGFQMFIDGLPMWGMVGLTDFDTGKYHLYTHSKFEIGYNGKQIVDINLTMGMSTELKAGARIMFSYEVQWKPSNVEFKNRSDLIQYKVS